MKIPRFDRQCMQPRTGIFNMPGDHMDNRYGNIVRLFLGCSLIDQ